MATAVRRREEPVRPHRPRTGRGQRNETAETAAEMPDILRALCEEHHYQLRVFRMLEKQVALLNQRKQADYEVMHGVMRYMTSYPDRFHHPKEDLVFRKLVERDPSSRPQVERLLDEHAQILARGAELLAVIDRCRADPKKAETYVLRKSAHKYIGLLRRHMDVEELRLFPRARQVLRPEDWAEVDANMKPILDPVFGETVAPEFQTLRALEERPRRPVPGLASPPDWIEAAAAVEAVSALLAGATEASSRVSAHNRAALDSNAAFLRDLRKAQPFSRRIALLREACVRNVRMARDVRRQVREVWSEAFRAARRPYQEKGTYATKLTEAFRRLTRSPERPSVAGALSPK